MSIAINTATCIGCGRCAAVCPGGLIKLSEGGRAAIARVRDCWGCTACVKECPTDSIAYFLGADMGGRGTRLSVKATDGKNVWTFIGQDGSRSTIVVDKTQGNKY